MDGNPNPSGRLRSTEISILLAVGTLTPIGTDSHASTDLCNRISGRQVGNSAIMGLKSSLGLAIPAVMGKKREDDVHPDTGESGETYDVEALGQFEWNPLQ